MIILGLIFIIMGSALIAVLIMSEQTNKLTILGSVSSVLLNWRRRLYTYL